jgi:hypothetical protein
MTGYLMSLNGLLKVQGTFMASVEDIDYVKVQRERQEKIAEYEANLKKGKKAGPPPSTLQTPAALKVKEVLGKVLELHTKLHADVTPAKREFAFGKLESHDLTELWRLLRTAFIPIFGLAASIDNLQRRAMEPDMATEATNEDGKRKQNQLIENVHFLMKELHDPFAQMHGEIECAIRHVLITLELVKPPKKSKKADEESKGDLPVPGSAGFAAYFK